MIEESSDKLLDRRGSALERHAQTGLTLLVVALLAWQLKTTQSLEISVGIFNNDMSHLKVELKRAIDTPNARIDDLMRRLDILEVYVLKNTDLVKQ